MLIEQFVMAYEAEQDRLRALLPEGFTSLRPVLRINCEIREGITGYLEFNTPVEKDGNRGWVNIARWDGVPFEKEGSATVFRLPELTISFTGVGIAGGCPAEKDNAGCYYWKKGWKLQKPQTILSPKEFCDCTFSWNLPEGAAGKSQGKTLPAYPSEVKMQYPRQAFTWENFARISCEQVLGTYVVRFESDREF